jgi:hypothetical protein
MQRKSHSDQELTDAATHVNYEVTMLRFHAGSTEPDNTTIEGFLLHARNLIEFLGWRASSRSTDILATDFVPGWTPPTPPDSSLSFTDVLSKIDKHLSHLTWDRVDQAATDIDGPPFPYQGIYNTVLSTFADFTQQAVSAQSAGATLFTTAVSGLVF